MVHTRSWAARNPHASIAAFQAVANDATTSDNQRILRRQQRQQRRQAENQRRTAARAQGGRSALLVGFTGRHYAAGGVPFADLHDHFFNVPRPRRAAQAQPPATAATNNFPRLNIDITAINFPGRVNTIISRVCDGLEDLITRSRPATGDLSQRNEGVTAFLTRSAAIMIANAFNDDEHDHTDVILPLPQPVAGQILQPIDGNLGGATGSIGIAIECEYLTGDLGNIGGKSDVVLMRRTQDPDGPNNGYVPLCVFEVKRDVLNLLDRGLAQCILGSAALGHESRVNSVVGVVTNLREWIFCRVENTRKLSLATSTLSTSQIQVLSATTIEIKAPLTTLWVRLSLCTGLL